ncbi:fatty acid-binding protein DegV [Sporanaerobium hydrogeniformans]|uniref:Fatty acid-binding protein DegV n=1 Tax=Sporanaerobium hydrogeniformans TaxID=3072179 RepID=A0AC61DH86_9FIRM|nr:DegV family protein [Sporanaerobium hydrogeniformans]PHV72041.1 fatty acid-binding protein DegV [Sporanaerobium hydrogeniformans]
MIKIVTDSTCYLPQEYSDTYDIRIVSLNVVLNGKSYRELDLSNDTFYEEMGKSTELPTSSQPSPEEMLTTFESIVSQGDSILGIFLSSQMSGTYTSAQLIKNIILEKYPQATIELFDSTSNCMQMGYMVLEAARFAKAGHSLQEVIAHTTAIREHSRFLFTPHVLDYLRKGGRIGGASALLGTLLQIKPILTVEKGKTTVFTKVRTKKKAIDTIIQQFLMDIQSAQLGEVIVHHINCPEEGQLLAAELEKHIHLKVKIQSIGPVIGLHVGPGSIGLAYYTL